MELIFKCPVQGAEDTDLQALFAGPSQHRSGGRAEERVELEPVVVEERPQDVWHGEGNVLPEDMCLLCDPLLCGFEAAGAAGL